MGFPRQEYWSGLPFLSPGDLLDPEIKLQSPALQADSLPSEPPGKISPKRLVEDIDRLPDQVWVCADNDNYIMAVA